MEQRSPLLQDILSHAENAGFGDLHFKIDKETGLCAMIAIHSTKNGPALGGCRCIEYTQASDAVYDAMRLARGMSYKAVMADVPHGGGKAVLIKPSEIKDRRAYFLAFGRFVQELNGRYITAVDSGTTIEDMDVISEVTPFIASSSKLKGDPSPFTADGVFHGMLAAIEHRLNRHDFKGLRVAIQGLGHVGLALAKRLHENGAELIVCDTNQNTMNYCINQFNAKAVAINEIYDVDCDVYAPCALGATLNDETIPRLKASIVAGCANNQLAESRNGFQLKEKNILYAPDYVINAGGLIYASYQYHAQFEPDLNQTETFTRKIEQIHDTLLKIFQRADQHNQPPHEVVDLIAEEKL